MPCTNPHTVYQVGIGTKPLWHKPEEPSVELQIPCNECISCLQRNAMDWSTRQYCEQVTTASKKLGTNLFLTTTYTNEHLPMFGHYEYRHMQLFWKRLRERLKHYVKKHGLNPQLAKFRYVTAPEYGEKTQRPHFHSNIFGIWLPDLQRGYRNENNQVFKSAMLEECWPYGQIDVQPFGMGSARYLAAHNMKQNGEPIKKQFKLAYYAKRERLAREQGVEHPFCTETGLIWPEKMPLPRIYCSNGIGREYYQQYAEEIFNNDSISINGQKYPVPRYFDKKLQEDNPDRWLELMAKREANQHEYTEQELRAIDEFKKHKRAFFTKTGKL